MHFKFKLTDSDFQHLVELLGGSVFHANRFVREAEYKMNEGLAEALEEQIIVSRNNASAAHRPQDGIGQCTIRIAKKLHDWLLMWHDRLYTKDEKFIRKLVNDPRYCLKPAVAKLPRIIKTRNLNPLPSSATTQGLVDAQGKPLSAKATPAVPAIIPTV